MVGEGMVRRSILLLFFIMIMISAASVKHSIAGTNNGSNAANNLCVLTPNTCAYGICVNGMCGPCPYEPLKCCLLSLGNCLSAEGVSYGLCAPTCGCFGCQAW